MKKDIEFELEQFEFGKAFYFCLTFFLHEVKKHGFATGQWTLELDGQVVASAQKLSAFKRSFILDTNRGKVSLMAESAFRRRFIVGGASGLIATISPRNLFTRKAQIEVLDEDLEFPVVVFCFWLVVLCWRRQQSAASG